MPQIIEPQLTAKTSIAVNPSGSMAHLVVGGLGSGETIAVQVCCNPDDAEGDQIWEQAYEGTVAITLSATNNSVGVPACARWRMIKATTAGLAGAYLYLPSNVSEQHG